MHYYQTPQVITTSILPSLNPSLHPHRDIAASDYVIAATATLLNSSITIYHYCPHTPFTSTTFQPYPLNRSHLLTKTTLPQFLYGVKTPISFSSQNNTYPYLTPSRPFLLFQYQTITTQANSHTSKGPPLTSLSQTVPTKIPYLPLRFLPHSVRPIVTPTVQTTLQCISPNLPKNLRTTRITPTINHNHRHPSEYTPHRNSEYNFHNQLPHNISHYQLCTLTCPNHTPTYPPSS